MTDRPQRGRPPVSSRGAVEEIAFELLLRDGYEATTVQAIMTAAGVGRTTFFRYFGSKGGIVWGEFDRAVERLRAGLTRAGEPPARDAPAHEPSTREPSVMRSIVDAVVESTRLSRDAAPETWLDRFRVLDQDPALAGDTAEHWRIWAAEVAGHVEERLGLPTGSVVAAAVGGAMQAAYVAVLRRWAAAASADVDVETMRADLEPVGTALQQLLDAA